MALTKITLNALADSSVDTDAVGANTITTAKIADINVTHAKLHTDMDLSSKTVTLPSAITDTITNKLPLTGGTLTGDLIINTSSNGILKLQEGGSDKGYIGAGGGGLYIKNLAGDVIFRNSSDADTIRIKDSGNVGIGTTSPSFGAGGFGLELAGAAGAGRPTIRIKDTVTANALQLSATATAAILESRSAGMDLVLGTSGAEKFRIDDTSGYLVAQHQAQVRLVLGSVGNSNNNTSNWIRGNQSYLQYNSAASGHTWEITGAEKMRIHSDGNVGIGVATPVRKLHVLSDTVGDVAAFEGTNNGIVIQGHSSDANIVEIVGYKQSDATYADVHIRANTDGLIVKEDTGNVGIGTTSPTNVKLQINKSGSDTVGDGHIGLGGSSTPLWAIRGGAADFDLRIDRSYAGWQSNPALSIRRMNGNVGIGTDNPGTPLHVDNGNVDGTILRLTNEEVGLNITVDGGTGNYSGSTRTVTLNATRFDGGSEPALRLAGQDRIDFATDANSVKASLYKNAGFNNASQLNLHNTYLRRSTEKITEWTAFTHCSTPDNANFLHIRTPIIAHPSGSYGAYQPVAMEIYGYHNYAAENFHDCTVVVNTTASGAFQANLRADNNNHNSLTVYRSSSTYNGYNRVCFSVPKNSCCCVGAIWVRFRWWSGLPTDNYAWGHTGTYSTADGF